MYWNLILIMINRLHAIPSELANCDGRNWRQRLQPCSSSRKKYRGGQNICSHSCWRHQFGHNSKKFQLQFLLIKLCHQLLYTFVASAIWISILLGCRLQDMIQLGAVNFIVPGNLPLGCSAAYLTYFRKSNMDDDYDEATGCINWLNDFAKHHNELLRIQLNRIRELHPHVTIIYADYYNSAMRFYRSPKEFGTSLSFYLAQLYYVILSQLEFPL